MVDSSKDGLQTTTTSLKIVDLISEMGGARMTELADCLDCSTSTVHAHLQTLLEQEYLIKRGEHYLLGLRLFHLGEQARTRNEWFGTVRTTVTTLADRSGEEAGFGVEEHGRVITLFNFAANRSTKGFQVGRYFHMHNSAAGKAILSQFPEDKVTEILDRRGMPAETDNTITDRKTLFETLDDIRERGYAVNDQESIEGARAVAVPVTGPRGGVLGALDISGPTYRLAPDEELAAIISEAVETLETKLYSR
ncbi:IclR family transcriptional regulator [Halovenus salina]|uniref:IclR family transcriptional regulator n=1 Tax=Halovenus salina TaxID=1510225 RepID=A0ABD5W752_9EURY|nr:IclR family transcriptional regulator [Halovenus salina]